MLTPEITSFVNRVRLGFVATVCEDGTPNLSPKGTVMAWDEEHLIFADIHSPGTISNLQSNPATEVNVVDIFCRKGYRFKGKGEVLSEGTLFDEVLSFYKAAGSKHAVKHVVLIRVEKLSAVMSPAYDLGLSEQEIRERWVQYWDEMNREQDSSLSVK